MVPTEAHGVLAAIGAALFWNLILLIGKFMQERQLPYLFMVGVASFFISLGAALLMFYRDSYHLERRDVKWVVLGGLMAGARNVLNACAVLAGAHVGSVGALSSVNTIVAALLGHFVLGEALSRLHLLALLLAIGGGVLTWSGASDPEVVGNTLAVLAGVSSGLSTICARKAGKASSLMLSTASTVARCPICLLLAFLPGVPDGRLQQLQLAPLQAALCFLLLLVLLAVRSLLASAACKKCPAAVSSTVMTGTRMSSGYVLDVLCLQKTLNLVTIAGAYMMLLAALTMAFAKAERAKATTSTEVSGDKEELHQEPHEHTVTGIL